MEIPLRSWVVRRPSASVVSFDHAPFDALASAGAVFGSHATAQGLPSLGIARTARSFARGIARRSSHVRFGCGRTVRRSTVVSGSPIVVSVASRGVAACGIATGAPPHANVRRARMGNNRVPIAVAPRGHAVLGPSKIRSFHLSPSTTPMTKCSTKATVFGCHRSLTIRELPQLRTFSRPSAIAAVIVFSMCIQPQEACILQSFQAGEIDS